MTGAAIAVAFGGVAGAAFVAGLFARRKTAAEATKTEAEATDVITQAAERVVTQLIRALDEAEATATRLAGELKTQRDTAARLEGEVDTLKAEIARLRELVIELGGDPTIGRRQADRL